jgi:predicted LPLAT superfamily acyltransferase
MKPSEEASARDWSSQRERGSLLLIRIMIWLTLRLGWHAGRALLFPISAYFYVASPKARAASRDFLSRSLGRRATAADSLRHFFTFSCVILDRLFLLTGRTSGFNVRVVGDEHLRALAARGQGCVLMGAHFGSFEILRALAARDSPVRVRALMYRANSGHLTGLFERLNPALSDSVIEIGRIDAMLRVRECVAAGEMVGILADRAPGDQRVVRAPFFGEDAVFPTGPMIVASVLRVPVLLFWGVRTGPRHYEVHFEPFADQIIVERARRHADLQRWTARFAERLEVRCRAHPYNWFNFFDFWKAEPHAADYARTEISRTSPGEQPVPDKPLAAAGARLRQGPRGAALRY